MTKLALGTTGDGPASNKVAVDFEEWINLPVANGTDEVKQYSTQNQVMHNDMDLFGWEREHHLTH